MSLHCAVFDKADIDKAVAVDVAEGCNVNETNAAKVNAAKHKSRYAVANVLCVDDARRKTRCANSAVYPHSEEQEANHADGFTPSAHTNERKNVKRINKTHNSPTAVAARGGRRALHRSKQKEPNKQQNSKEQAPNSHHAKAHTATRACNYRSSVDIYTAKQFNS